GDVTTLDRVLHHMTLWVPDLERAQESWSWLLGQLGYVLDPSFDGVVVLRHPEGFAVALEQSSDMVPGMLYSRMRPGLNHMAFNLAPHSSLDDIVADAREHRWASMPANRHPIAS